MRRSRRPWCFPFALAALLASAVCSAELVSTDSWIEVQTEHLQLLSNAGRGTTIQIGDRLEQLWQVLAATFADVASRPPTWIYVFRDAAAMAPFNLGADGRPDSVAGYYVASPLANYLVIDASAEADPFRAVHHEFVHYFVHNNLPYVPLWLNEGLAEYYSTIRLTHTRAELGLPIAEHRRWLAQHTPIPLAELFPIEPESPDYRVSRDGFYAQSWALTHYLMSLPDKMRMQDLLRALRQGATSEQAIARAFQLDLPALERELAGYGGDRPLAAQEWRFGEWKAAPSVTRSVERAAVLFHLGDLLTHRTFIPFESADEYLLAALDADSTRAEVYASLGQLRHEAWRDDESHWLFARALAMAPDDAAIRLGYGLSLVEQFFRAEAGQPMSASETPPLLGQARTVLRPLVVSSVPGVEDELAFGRTFLLDRGPLAEGITALNRVVKQEPWRTDAIRDLIALTAHSGDVAGARSLLESELRPRGSAELVRQAEMIIGEAESRAQPKPAGE